MSESYGVGDKVFVYNKGNVLAGYYFYYLQGDETFDMVYVEVFYSDNSGELMMKFKTDSYLVSKCPSYSRFAWVG